MIKKAQLFVDGNHQVVRLPEGYRFEGSEIYIRQDPATGDVILSRKPMSWSAFFAEDVSDIVPKDFMTDADRRQGRHERDPFSGGD